MMKVFTTPFVPNREHMDAAGGSINVVVPTTLLRVVCVSAGTAGITFYDTADGAGGVGSATKLAALPTTTTVGQVFDFQVPAFKGIYAAGGTGTPEINLVHAPSQTN